MKTKPMCFKPETVVWPCSCFVRVGFLIMPIRARLFISVVCLVGITALVWGAWTFRIDDLLKFSCYCVISLIASRLKVNLPEISGTVSVNFLFILIGIVELNFSETLIIGCLAITAQCFFSGSGWPRPSRLLFNVCNSSTAIWAAYFIYHGPLHVYVQTSPSLLLMLSACTYFILNTLPVAAIISLTESKKLRKVWTDCYFWSFPYYLMGAAIASMVGWMNHRVNWQTSLLAFPAMFVIYRSYRMYLSKLENGKMR